MDEPVTESTQENQATTSEDAAIEEADPAPSGVEEGMEDAPQPSDSDAQGNEAQTQDEVVASSENTEIEQSVETTDQGICGL